MELGCEAEFERVRETLMQIAANFEGYLGAQLVHPDDDPEVQKSQYHVVLAFAAKPILTAGTTLQKDGWVWPRRCP